MFTGIFKCSLFVNNLEKVNIGQDGFYIIFTALYEKKY